MSRKVYELFSKTARQCAPVIMGVKEANLLKIKRGNEETIRNFFRGTDIEIKKLYDINSYSIYIVFKRQALEEYVLKEENLRILLENEYKDVDFNSMLDVLSSRCKLWSKNYNEYPHEIGIFLGYPTNDVREFIRNKGENFLEMGYWKVYGDVEKARSLFDTYDRAQDAVMEYFYSNAVCEENVYMNESFI